MFTAIVGSPIDPFAAGIALATLCVCVCIFCTTWIAKRRSRLEISHDFELAKIRLHDAQEIALKSEERAREYNLQQSENSKVVELTRIQSSIGLLDVSPEARAARDKAG